MADTAGAHITKNNSGFPAYLDFDALRRQGIDYLGKLSGKIWTDHNVHDPGITILETLCYAMLDLGYRTNFPVADIFAKAKDDKSPDDNFFTPAQALGSNPLTIMDYRKLLIDIAEVNNAWLEPASDFNPDAFCNRQNPNMMNVAAVAGNAGAAVTPNCEYLNGLYHVYIDPRPNNDPSVSTAAYEKLVLKKVRETLLCHRNFCEDFLDIHLLCPQEIGVCAEIELERNADAELIYMRIVEALRDFISPSPVFYTLQQMIAKKKSIEEIFAGRPYDIKESHGFVDTDEFEKIKRKKEIHLSDIYQVLLNIPGIETVRNLALRDCKTGPQANEWKFVLNKDHIPKFSINCSGFRFTHSGIPINLNAEAYKKQFADTDATGGKILSGQTSPYLDLAIPEGVYHKDIDQYYSIQNDLPRVYGIARGGLSDKAPVERKMRALQLKAYLLFFDQQFSNYLAQLKNIRSLFSFSPPEKQTYFTGNVDSIPDLQELLFFKPGDHGDSTLGKEEDVLVYPVKKNDLLPFINNEKVKNKKISDIKPYLFTDSTDCEWSMIQFQEDILQTENIQIDIVKECDNLFYYIESPGDDFVLLSKHHFKSEQDARGAADTVKYMGAFRKNYKKFIAPGTYKHSFNIELNLSSYPQYLQLMTEDTELYNQRRKGFLNHLLSRFAEQFTDYALLSFNARYPDYIAKENKVKEKFLLSYNDVSGNRGRAYDYSMSGCIENNSSGFEKRFKALTGIDNDHKASLCNFEVVAYEKQYIISVNIAGKQLFTTAEKYSSPEEAHKEAGELFHALASGRYNVEKLSREPESRISVLYGESKKAYFTQAYYDTSYASDTAMHLQRMFAEAGSKDDTRVSRFVYQPILLNHANVAVKSLVEPYYEKEEAWTQARKLGKDINKAEKWVPKTNEGSKVGKLIFQQGTTDAEVFIDVDAFDIITNAAIPKKPGKHSYVLLDKADHWFKFVSNQDFDKQKLAEADSHRLLLLMLDRRNYHKPEDGSPVIHVKDGDEVIAVSDFQLSKDSIDDTITKVHDIVRQHTYRIHVDQESDRWRFRYHLGYEQGGHYIFESDTDYTSEPKALEALDKFIGAMPDLRLDIKGSVASLVPTGTNKKVSPCSLQMEEEVPVSETTQQDLQQLLDISNGIAVLKKDTSPEKFKEFIDEDPVSKDGRYVYRLIDRDGMLAFSAIEFKIKTEAEAGLKNVIVRGKKGYDYIDICLGGDIVVQREDKCKKIWHHFVVKCKNRQYKSGPLKGENVVLFESTRGYLSKEEAQKAFEELFMLILEKGRDRSEYGKWIGLEEIRVQTTDPYEKVVHQVFIPKATLDDLGAHDDAAITELVKWVKSYPIRSIRKKDKDFHDRFPCITVTEDDDKSCTCGCGHDAEKIVYYFAATDIVTGDEEWQSVLYYESFEEARGRFYFFLTLLKYWGNYYIDCDPCNGKYRVLLREVLLESIEKFIDEPTAWGEKGVQRFITVANTKQAFHTRPSHKPCCYDFYVACSEAFIYHPCQYDSYEQRDLVIECLREAYKEIAAWDIAAILDPGNSIIKDYDGKPVAKVVEEKKQPNQVKRNSCEWYVWIMDSILTIGLCADKKGVYLNDISYRFEPLSDEYVNPQVLKQKLIWLAWYFPIIKTTSDKYCIEIRIPGFNDYRKDWKEQLYQDDSNLSGCASHNCGAAWKSKCCYDTCEEAINYFQEALKLLALYRSYQPVFQCECGPYGIALHNEKDIGGYIVDNIDPAVIFDISIIARNPQCYPNAKEVCDAAERALRLTNSEGLHAVEHILLRPHCKPVVGQKRNECDCLIPGCNKFSDCEFDQWKEKAKDPCEARINACFTPGKDPYSFIATIVLPAWPHRFRNTSNRQIIEQLLNREAPAHVLVRILWLTPHDMLEFEAHYRNWQRKLAKNTLCSTEFDVCEFISFLFSGQLECMKDIDACGCKNIEKTDALDQCADLNKTFAKKSTDYDWVNQVNDMYCWHTYDCVPALVSAQTLFTKKRPQKRIRLKQPTPVRQQVSDNDKTDVINERISNYLRQVEEMKSKTRAESDKRIMSHAITLQESGDLQMENFGEFMNIVLNKMNETGKEQLSKGTGEFLISNMMYYYLDSMMNRQEASLFDKDSSKVFNKLRKNKIDMETIFYNWDPYPWDDEQTKETRDKVFKLFTGKKR